MVSSDPGDQRTADPAGSGAPSVWQKPRPCFTASPTADGVGGRPRDGRSSTSIEPLPRGRPTAAARRYRKVLPTLNYRKTGATGTPRAGIVRSVLGVTPG